MEDLREYIEKRIDETMRKAGFIPQTPQKETKEPTTISGTITFLGTETLARMKVKQNQQETDTQQEMEENNNSIYDEEELPF